MLGLNSYARKALISEQELLAALEGPLLVWETQAQDDDESLWMGTAGAKLTNSRPRASEPLVLPLRKAIDKANPFSMGITLGRAPNNDLVIADTSISRFHAYVVHAANGWSLVDAESRNGTWVGPLKLAPSVPVTLLDRSRLRLGEVELVFLTPASFGRYLREKMKA